jgi:hypothetical protein
VTNTFLILGDAHHNGASPPVENFEVFRRIDGSIFGPELSQIRWATLATGSVTGTFARGDCILAGNKATQVVASGGRTLTFATAETITASSGSFVTDGYQPGMRLRVRGTTNNNGAYKIAAVTATVLTVQSSDVLVAEGPLSSAATLDATQGPANRVTASGGRTLTFNASAKTITASSGSWINDGYEVGHRVKITGTADNDIAVTIAALTATVMTVSEVGYLVDEGPLSSVAVVDGTFGPFGYIVDIVGLTTGSGGFFIGIASIVDGFVADTWESLDWQLSDPTHPVSTTALTPATANLVSDPKKMADGSVGDLPTHHAGNQLNWKFQRKTDNKAIWWDGLAKWGPAQQVTASGGRTLTFAANSPPSVPATVTASSGAFTTTDGYKSGMTLTVAGSSSNNGTYEIATVAATVLTLKSTEALVNEGPLSSTCTLNAAQATAGHWTEYCPIPNWNGYGRTFLLKKDWVPYFEVPPRGSNWQANGQGRGVDPLFIDAMYTADQNARALKIGNANGSLYIAELDYTGRTNNFTVGAKITGGTSGATGIIVAIDDDGASAGRLYINTLVKGTTWFQSGEPITDDGTYTGTATTSSLAVGWIKGSTQYQAALDEYLKATASDKWTSLSSTQWDVNPLSPVLKCVMLMVYVRDLQIKVAGATTSGSANEASEVTSTFTTDYEAGLKQFISDWKADTSSTPIFSVGMPAEDYQDATFPLRAVAIKANVATVERDVANVIKWDAEGFTFAGTTSAVDTSTSAKVWYEAAAYDTFGIRGWEAYVLASQSFSPPAGAGVPLYVEIGQSQAVSVTGAGLFLLLDGDGDVGKFNNIMLSLNPAGSAVSTVDGRRWIFNGVSWAVYSHSANNSSPLGNGNLGNFGPEAGFFDSLVQKHLDTGAYLFKMAQSTSCLSKDATGQTGCWAKGGSNISATTGSVSVSFAANGTISAAAGAPFTGFIAGEYVQIIGSAAGNNFELFQNAKITSVAGDGKSIVVATTFTVEGPVTCTITMGPIAMYEYLLTFLKNAMAALVTQLGVFPDLQCVFMIGPSEGDLGSDTIAAAHQANLQQFIDDFRSDFQTRTSGRDVAFILAKLTEKTPLGTDTAVASVRAAQVAVAAGDTHIVAIETNTYPMQADSAQTPGGLGVSFGDLSSAAGSRRTGYGVHWTPRGVLDLGLAMGTAWTTLYANEAPTVSTSSEASSGDEDLDDGAGSGGGALASAFEVETGSASTTSNSYASVAQGDSYFAAIGATYWTATATTQAQKEQALRIATAWLDDKYRGQWKGTAGDEDQSLAWPRYGVYNAEGYYIDEDVVPVLLVQATLEMAELHLGGTDLTLDLSAGGTNISMDKVKIGPLEVQTSFENSNSNTQPIFTTISRKLSGLLKRIGGPVALLQRT